MSAICTAPATALAVDLAAAREAIRMTETDLDGQLTLSIQGLAAEVESMTGQCLMEQGWRVTLDQFPAPCAGEAVIELPHPALAVQSVTYVDLAGANQTLAPAAYELVVERYRSYLSPATGSWPAAAARPRAVKISCTAGYGSDATKTPPVARQYILARLELEYCPPLNPPSREILDRMLDSLNCYA
ncbi:hypothetical protein ACLB1G_21900 [Oxalobacteraceae bacterium A2-2]